MLTHRQNLISSYHSIEKYIKDLSYPINHPSIRSTYFRKHPLMFGNLSPECRVWTLAASDYYL